MVKVADVVELLVPYDRGDVVAAVHREGEVLVEAHEEDATRIRARLDEVGAARFREFVVAAPYVLLDGLVEVRDHVGDHPGRGGRGQPRGGDHVTDEVGLHTGVRHGSNVPARRAEQSGRL